MARGGAGELVAGEETGRNLRNGVAGFSRNMREVIEMFELDQHDLEGRRGGRLCEVVRRYGDRKVDLHPGGFVRGQGTVVEELVGKSQ